MAISRHVSNKAQKGALPFLQGFGTAAPGTFADWLNNLSTERSGGRERPPWNATGVIVRSIAARLEAIAFFLVLAGTACRTSPDRVMLRQATPDPSISTDGYDQSCVSVADCIIVHAGTVSCCDSGCPNAVIKQSVLPAYLDELASIVKVACGGADPNSPVVCHGGAPSLSPPVGCQEGRAACQDGVCTLLTGRDASLAD